MMSDGADLYWIPLGAGTGGAIVRWSGRLYEALTATIARRPRRDLYHAALLVHTNHTATAIEMAAVWSHHGDRGVVAEGPVGSPILGRSRLFRYEVRAWNGGSIPDLTAAMGDPVRLTNDPQTAKRIVALAAHVPTLTWGRDELHTGDMWNSNSLIAWLLARANLDTDHIGPPPGGRAPAGTQASEQPPKRTISTHSTIPTPVVLRRAQSDQPAAIVRDISQDVGPYPPEGPGF